MIALVVSIIIQLKNKVCFKPAFKNFPIFQLFY